MIEVQHVAVTRTDGSLSVLQIVTRAPLEAFSSEAALSKGFVIAEIDGEEVWDNGITPEGVEAEIARAGYKATSWRLLNPTELPADRDFRDAWVDTGTVTVDMPKAREIHRGRLRILRAPLMAQLDVSFLRELEALIEKLPLSDADKQPVRAVMASKQALRDVPSDASIDGAKTPDELKGAIPPAIVEAQGVTAPAAKV